MNNYRDGLPSLEQINLFIMEGASPNNTNMESILNNQFVQLKETLNNILKSKTTVCVNSFINILEFY